VVAAPAALLAPATAIRVRQSQYSDTPIQPDEPIAKNPPEGAIIDYWLAAEQAVTIEILSGGKLVRRFSSADNAGPIRDEGNIPRWWIRPAAIPSAAKGLHRFVWDL